MNEPPNRILRIATRQSPLALWQAEFIAGRLQQLGVESQLVPLSSLGDTDQRPIDGSRTVGLFTKRIQQAVIDHDADLAVHSLKDLPTEPDERLHLAAVPERGPIHDCLVSQESGSLAQLPDGARVGTGSRRRGAQLKYHRPDLQILPIRGNLQTRLEKWRSGQFDAIILAEAGLVRLQMDQLPHSRLSLEEMLPAPGQGALGVEVRADDWHARETLQRIDDAAARAAVTAERTLLANLHGGCLAPIAALGQFDGNRFRLSARVLSADGTQRLSESEQCDSHVDKWRADAVAVAQSISDALVAQGARELITQSR